MSDKQRITLDPNPPVQGEDVTITYDFSGLSLAETRLQILFDGDSGPVITVTPDDPSQTVPVPASADTILVEDLDGPSPDKSAPVVSGSTAGV